MKYNKVNTAVILAGGFGTRFLPATLGVCKEMFSVLDKPILFYHLKECAECNITNIVVVSNKSKQEINKFINPNKKILKKLKQENKTLLLKEYFSVLNKLNIKIVYQKKQNGTGGALLKAKRCIKKQPFLLINGDDLFMGKQVSTKLLLKLYNKTGLNISLIKQVDKAKIKNYGCAKLTQQNKLLYLNQIIEKPMANKAPSCYAVLGKHILNYQIFKHLKNINCHNGEYYVTDAINVLASQNKCLACIFDGEYIDCGNKLEFAKFYVNQVLESKQYGAKFLSFLKQKTNNEYFFKM